MDDLTVPERLLDALIGRYLVAKENLDHYKKLEKKLRIELLDELFPSAIQGVHTSMFDGLELKGTFKLNHKLDLDALCEQRQYFTEEEEECIVEKLSIVAGKYNNLPASMRESLDECVITTNALPTLVITEEDPSL